MKLIVGLGNIGNNYTHTRHNIGFQVLDAYATHRNSEWTNKPKFKADIAIFTVSGEHITLVKPTTMYNLVGEAAQRIAHYYTVEPSDILVVHDELMLPFGTIRTRLGGSDAGNNGLKSLHSHIGQGTARIRIGIYNELRDMMNDADFVLSKFSAKEASILPQLTSGAIEHIDSFVDGSFTSHTATFDIDITNQ